MKSRSCKDFSDNVVLIVLPVLCVLIVLQFSWRGSTKGRARLGVKRQS